MFKSNNQWSRTLPVGSQLLLTSLLWRKWCSLWVLGFVYMSQALPHRTLGSSSQPGANRIVPSGWGGWSWRGGPRPEEPNSGALAPLLPGRGRSMCWAFFCQWGSGWTELSLPCGCCPEPPPASVCTCRWPAGLLGGAEGAGHLASASSPLPYSLGWKVPECFPHRGFR